jgi:hypothetical protein
VSSRLRELCGAQGDVLAECMVTSYIKRSLGDPCYQGVSLDVASKELVKKARAFFYGRVRGSGEHPWQLTKLMSAHV